MDLVAPDLLQGYRVDAWVNTACPRIAIEDILQYKQPMLTPQEFEIVLGERTWDDYVFDEIRAWPPITAILTIVRRSRISPPRMRPVYDDPRIVASDAAWRRCSSAIAR